MELPYIKLNDAVDDVVTVEVIDTEVFEYIEDFLVEVHGLVYTSVQIEELLDETTHYIMEFPVEFKTRIQLALLELDPEELRRIYAINNPRSA